MANGTEKKPLDKSEKEAERRKHRRETKKSHKKDRRSATAATPAQKAEGTKARENGEEAVEVEYVTAPLGGMGEDEDNPIFKEFQEIFQKFDLATLREAEAAAAAAEGLEAAATAAAEAANEGEDGEDDAAESKLSKKKKKLLRRMKVAELKQVCRRPEVVEMWDVTSNDPRLLVFLKAYRNTVPVPRHWSQKRKFLQGKRGIEKPPWELPDFLAATGIGKVREAAAEKDDSKSLKQKGKDRMQPKMNKIDIDYQILHDAFFKYQEKPKLSGVGDLYYEGKEFEMQLGKVKPGVIGEALKSALGLPDGAPPPWLINMQRYGPPPSYQNLKIPGLSAPIPDGATFGYHPGGWGKPPVDEMGNPLYGDVFNTRSQRLAPAAATPFDVPVDRVAKWGDLESEEEEEEDEEDEEGADGEGGTELGEDEVAAGSASVMSLQSSLPSGVETPSVIDLRKEKAPSAARPLYQVLEEQEAHVGAGSLMGASHTYVVPGAGGRPAKGAAAKGDVALTLRPEDLEGGGLDDAQIAARFVEAERAEKGAGREDFSDMVAEHAQRAKRKIDAKKKDQADKKFKF